MTQPICELSLHLPRHAFSVRDAARAGDLWRCFQEAAVGGSTQAGWPPQRYRAMGTAFVVREMRVVHHREAVYGESVRGRTWVSRFRRGMLSTREVRLRGDRGALASATQEWVHVGPDLKPRRAPEDLSRCFPVHAPEDGQDAGSIHLPPWEELKGPVARFSFRCWHTWMDPLDHVNHPAYLDWCDEGIARHVDHCGLSPVALRPVAEKVVFRAPVSAREHVHVESRRIGRTEHGEVVLSHRILKDDGTLCADAITVRSVVRGEPSALVEAWAE